MTLPPECLVHTRQLVASGQRKIPGIVAPPGAGKSTLAATLASAFPQNICIVPMDGFHLARTELARLGKAARKGAPDTFDSAGYVELLRRIKMQQPGETIYAPEFRRELEEAVAGAIAVEAHIPLVIAEGNYLLLGDEPWAQIRGVLDEVWYLEVDGAVRLERLLNRHMHFGRSRAQALKWIALTDEPNARRIETTRHRADPIVKVNEDSANHTNIK
jgi:pantothenate kinase